MGKPKIEKLIKKGDVNGLLAALAYEGEGVSPAFERFETRTKAAEALGNLGSPDAIEPLRRALGDVSEQISKYTAMAPDMIKAADEVMERATRFRPSPSTEAQSPEYLQENLQMMEVMMAAVEMNRQSGVVYGRALRKLGDQDASLTEQFLATVKAFDEKKAEQSSREIQQQ
ncbi:MAG: hypothetical protein ACRDH6_03455 [Actinomycetota bacterium]